MSAVDAFGNEARSVRRKLRAVLVGAIIALGVLAAPSVSAAASFTVNSTDDANDGTCNGSHCSLREAINAANSAAGADTIAFSIPGPAPHSIKPLSPLPDTTDPVTIDGTTEPDFAGSPIVELDGSLAGLATGLVIAGGHSTVRGLVINRFSQAGIRLEDCCSVPPVLGDNVVQGNFVGTDVTGTIALGNGVAGVHLFNTPRNLIGGTGAGRGNLISGNVRGIRTEHPGTSDNLVQGNLIGTQRDGSSPLGQVEEGVLIGDGSNNTIGGTVAGAKNTIAFNGVSQGSGVQVQGGTGNAILRNSIHSNVTMGINLYVSDLVTPNDPGDADTGPNNLQNFPVITSATSVGNSSTVQGTLNSEANKTYRLEFFSTPECDPWRAFAADEFGHGEGKTFLGSRNVTTDGGGDASFRFTAGTATPAGHVITSTATDPDNNTSEFSMCKPVSPGPPPPAMLP
jgi:CSLREA domain-containing protein